MLTNKELGFVGIFIDIAFGLGGIAFTVWVLKCTVLEALIGFAMGRIILVKLGVFKRWIGFE